MCEREWHALRRGEDVGVLETWVGAPRWTYPVGCVSKG